MLNPFEETIWPLGDQIEAIIKFIVNNFRFIFHDWIGKPVGIILKGIQSVFVGINPIIFLGLLCAIAWQIASRNIAIFSVIAMTIVGLIGAWEKSMVTLALVITAVCFCIIIGVPLGILAAQSDRFASLIRPVLDTMQTLPAFVYLVPVVMLFGTGEVPGVIVTFIFAVPPLIRLTNLGIRNVSQDVVEAAQAFGSTPLQTLWEVKIPLAMPTILTGVNQSLMLALSMVVIASLIAVEGLGQMVNRGIGRLDVGLAAVGGIAIVLMAIVLDRITQGIGHASQRQLHWRQRGPMGFVFKVIKKFAQKTNF